MRIAGFLFVFITALLVSVEAAATLATNIGQVRSAEQRGAIFMNYCSGCHALRYMRYHQLAADLNLASFPQATGSKILLNNLTHPTAQDSDTIRVSMPLNDARAWFGTVPPDLSLIARQKSPAWIKAYLESFYVDNSRPFASNNSLVHNTAMPNVLMPLIGRVIAIRKNTASTPTIFYLQQVRKGEMSAGELDEALQDLVSFLVYVGEPYRTNHYIMGIFVMLFLLIFLWVALKIKKCYW